MTMKDEQPVVDRLNEAIRENPLAAALIGAGVAWMLLGSKGLGTAAGVAKDAAKSAANTVAAAAGSAAAGVGSATADAASRASSAARNVAGGARKTAGRAHDTASGAAESAATLVPELPDADQASEAMADMSAAVGERVRAAADSGREYGAAIQSRLAESLERQPLLLGAIGLAIGAGIAASFVTTEVEKEWVGKSAAAARDKVGDAVADHGRKVMSDVRGEADRQGLTPEAIREAAKSVADKAKTVAKAARESAT